MVLTMLIPLSPFYASILKELATYVDHCVSTLKKNPEYRIERIISKKPEKAWNVWGWQITQICYTGKIQIVDHQCQPWGSAR